MSTVKPLHRYEIRDLMLGEGRHFVLGTALLFLFAGSLWSHFSMGPVTMEWPLFLCWSLIHVCGFLCIPFKRLDKILIASSIVALNLYYYLGLVRYQLPYLPTAPLFFIVSSIAVSAHMALGLRATGAAWSTAWMSHLLWIHFFIHSEKAPLFDFASKFLILCNFIFVATYILAFHFFEKRFHSRVKMMSSKELFDEQRIQASKLQSLGTLVASVSHEINNPLSAIKGYAYTVDQELQSQNATKEQTIKHANERILFNVHRVGKIVSNLKTFSRDTSHDEQHPVSIKDVIDDSLSLVSADIRAKGVELFVDIPENDAIVRGNAIELSQLLVNLLSNARDACLLSERKKITTGFRIENNQVILWVEDTGPGIDSQHKDKLFQSFFTTKELGKGTGLGLYISQSIAQKHQANLQFKNQEDSLGKARGAVFWIALRLADSQNSSNDSTPTAA